MVDLRILTAGCTWARRSCLTNVEREAIARWDANITMGRRYYYGTQILPWDAYGAENVRLDGSDVPDAYAASGRKQLRLGGTFFS
jgi:hypothetical protein